MFEEARRVLKPGCPISIVSILWEHCRFYGADRALNELITEAWRAHCFHQMLPLELPALLKKNGFSGLRLQNISFLDTALHAGTTSFYLSKLIAKFATSQGVSEEDASLWLSQFDVANKEERFGFVDFPVLTVAIAILSHTHSGRPPPYLLELGWTTQWVFTSLVQGPSGTDRIGVGYFLI